MTTNKLIVPEKDNTKIEKEHKQIIANTNTKLALNVTVKIYRITMMILIITILLANIFNIFYRKNNTPYIDDTIYYKATTNVNK